MDLGVWLHVRKVLSTSHHLLLDSLLFWFVLKFLLLAKKSKLLAVAFEAKCLWFLKLFWKGVWYSSIFRWLIEISVRFIWWKFSSILPYFHDKNATKFRIMCHGINNVILAKLFQWKFGSILLHFHIEIWQSFAFRCVTAHL